MVAINQPETDDYVIATRDSDCSYAMIYIPTGKETWIDIQAFGIKSLRAGGMIREPEFLLKDQPSQNPKIFCPSPYSW